MKVLIHINGSHDPARTNFLSWSPSPCEARLTEVPPGFGPGPVEVEIRNQRTDVGGQVEFYPARNTAASATLRLSLPVSGAAVPFLAAGRFQRASTENGDAAIEAVMGPGTVLGTTTLMVRVRKDANTLTDGERTRFLDAMATLNNQGHGRFSEFRAMHDGSVEEEAHGRPGFVGWHRAYLLDLERELQAIDPSVTLPYWRFDVKAPNLFSANFIGVPSSTGTVTFTADNPLQFWRTDQGDGITRAAYFNTATQPATNPVFGPGVTVRTENQVLNRSSSFELFSNRSGLEGNPHGYAHVSFIGQIDDPPTAPKDPLFFLLHCNVDRLWAKWQWFYKRFDVTLPGNVTFKPGNRIGHRLPDTMWPWNGDTQFPRPSTPAPGGFLAVSPIVTAPGNQPRLEQMFDYQGILASANRLDFDYDDVPFEWAQPPAPPIA